MKVRVLPGRAIFDGPVPCGPGAVVDLPPGDAKRMIGNGTASAVEAPKKAPAKKTPAKKTPAKKAAE